MALIRHEKSTEYSFYKWIKIYPKSKCWIERIKKCPDLKIVPLLETHKFYRFVKTACKNRALRWLDWNKIEKIILKEIKILNKSELGELRNIFNHLVNFYKTPAIRGYGVENYGEHNKIKEGNCIERGYAKGKFYEKEIPMNIPKGYMVKYDKKSKRYVK